MGKGWNVESLDLVGGNAILDLVACKEEPAFVILIGHAPGAADQHLFHFGKSKQRFGAQDLFVRWHFPPPKEAESAFGDDLLRDGFGTCAGILVVTG